VSNEVLDWDQAYCEYRNKVVVRGLIAVMVLLVALLGYAVTTEDAKPRTVAGAPVKALQPVPVEPLSTRPITSFDELLKGFVDVYTVEYEKLLSDSTETARVTDYLIADREPSAFTIPVDSTDLVAEIVANATPEESQQFLLSVHGYPMCTLQDGGIGELVGYHLSGTLFVTLLQYAAPSVTDFDGQHCTGGEYFFVSPEMASRILLK
jgi:hypothetical protein